MKTVHVSSADTDRFIAVIQHSICERFGLPSRDLVGKRRDLRTVWPRQIAMALAYEFTSAGSQRIAGLFNCADHGTVLNAVKRVRDICYVYPRERQLLEELRATLNNISGKTEL